jgi:mRNA-degrading endonuclease RelE of RelBE toxin-antitoxin system
MRDVRISDQVYDYIRALPPVPKQRLRAGLRGLANLESDLKDLERQLDGYCRLRVHQFRIILKVHQGHVDCIFIERRNIVYEVFQASLR